MKIFTSLFFCLSFVAVVSAQSNDNETIARDYLQEHLADWGLTYQDVLDLRLADATYSRQSGVDHLYFIQRFQGVDVYNSIYNISIKDGNVVHAAQRLIPHLMDKIGSQAQRISPSVALVKALGNEGAVVNRSVLTPVSVAARKTVFSKIDITDSDIPVRLIYMPDGNGKYHLSWVAEFQLTGGSDLWNVAVNAETGEVMQKISLTQHCTFEDSYLRQQHLCEEQVIENTLTTITSGDGAQYKVIPFPNESPIHGGFALLEDPADTMASPFGWHDTDGAEGPEFTHTEGNNTHAFVDRDNNNIADTIIANGGPQLNFDFPFDAEMEPVGYQEAAVTNMFYAVNFMHDFTYHYGFDEDGGNFQLNNYSGLGVGGDYVIARNQVGAGLSEPPLNNASFGTPADGGNGRMQMFVWEGGANKLLTVEEPPEVAGKYTTSTTVDWGVVVSSTPVTASVVLVDDGTGQSTLGCNELQNTEELEGNIALIDRGSCEFGRKALNAEEAGAIGAIICNFEEGYVNMGAGAVGSLVNIPVIFINYSDCQTIRTYIGNGLTVSLVNDSGGEQGPTRKDAALDNGIIAHEFGHGISNRLTGGPSFSGCLTNYDTDNDGNADQGEQMGEGWSDFFTLVTTVKPGDTRFMPRGVGNYADDKEPGANGIRRYAYNTDMSLNPLTYDDIAFESVPHGVGTVWASTLWDMYWDFVDTYGFDEDLIHGTGGNNLAIRLVMEGMKMQPCNPGFLDGRNAILNADVVITGGENQELIWQAFARRGLGWSAKQGTEMLRHDNKEAYDMPPYLVKELKLQKFSTPVIDPGEEFSVTILAINDMDVEVTNVAVTDVIPENTQISQAPTLPHEIAGSEIIIEVGNIAPGDTATVTYSLLSDNLTVSDRLFYDGFEEGEFNWVNIIDDGTVLWEHQDFFFNSGQYAMWFVNEGALTDGSLINIDPIEVDADNPVLRFYHNYDTEPFYDAGILMISTDEGVTYYPVESDKFIRGNYSGKVTYSLYAIANQRAFHGNSNGWVASYVDLSDYIGETIHLRFRFASDDNTSGLGWGIDDVEVLDGFFYDTEACITSDQTNSICTTAKERGTFVNYDMVSAIHDPESGDFGVSVYPNPNDGTFRVDLSSEESQKFRLSVRTLEGKLLWSTSERVQGLQNIPVRIQGAPEGFYILEVEGETDRTVRKLVIR